MDNPTEIESVTLVYSNDTVTSIVINGESQVIETPNIVDNRPSDDSDEKTDRD